MLTIDMVIQFYVNKSYFDIENHVIILNKWIILCHKNINERKYNIFLYLKYIYNNIEGRYNIEGERTFFV